MSDAEDRRPEVAEDREAPGAGRSDRMRVRFAAARARAKSARERHVSVAVPFRAAERNRRVASSVLAGGFAHSLVWDEPPPRTNPLKGSLAFTGIVCALVAAVALTWWLREETWLVGLLAAALTIALLAALWLWVSLPLPHRDAPWQALLPGALVVGLGFQVLHVLIVQFLGPKLEKSTSLYGALGAVTTLLFFMYIVGSLVVAAPVLNSSLHHELREQGNKARDDGTTSPAEASPG